MMNGKSERRPSLRPTFQRLRRLGAQAVMMILVVTACGVTGADARQRGRIGQRQPQQGLRPGERNPPNRPVNEPPMRESLTEEERRDMRLVPPGVAFPRVLIRVFRQLDLSNEQRERLEQLSRRAGNQVPALNRLRRAQSELLDEALYGENFDPQLVEKRANDLASTQAELIKLQARLMSSIRQILTPEQSAKFRELLTREREERQ